MTRKWGGLTTQERFETKYMPEPMSGCWLWLGDMRPSGYGRHGHKGIAAHRFSWEMHRGKIPEGLCVLHKCDVRSCVNPDHLFLGTNADNSADMVAKGRSSTGFVSPELRPRGDHHWSRRKPELAARGTGHGGAKLTEEAVADIRSSALSQRALAQKYDVSQYAIWGARAGKYWRHVP